MLQQVKNELFAVPATNEVHLRALQLDQRGVETGKHASKRQLHLAVGGTDLAGEDFGVRITGRTQKTQAHESRLPPLDLLDNDPIGRFGIGLVKHHALVARAFQYRRERHNADGRKPHHANLSIPGASPGWKGVKLRVSDVD